MSSATLTSTPGLSSIAYHLRTLHLFTQRDIITCLIPVTAFACVAGPVHSWMSLLHAVFWLWIHLLQCNVSNQYTGAAEDAINKPWRPIPAGRITSSNAWRLRVALPFICLAVSVPYGNLVMLASIGASVSELWYDELGGAKFWVTKNLCSAFAYSMAELGATLVASRGHTLDETALKSLIFAGIIFASTLHAADFPDVIGDKAQGRVTLPMLFPEASRMGFALTVVGWSIHLASSSGWAIGPLCKALFVALGIYVGARVVLMRSEAADKMSYNWYDVWMLICFMLPAQARWGIFSF